MSEFLTIQSLLNADRQSTDTTSDAPASPTSGPDRPAQQRTSRRTRACLTCHMKKVRCEGAEPRCSTCARSNAECLWVQTRKRGPKTKARRAGGASRFDGYAEAPVFIPQLARRPPAVGTLLREFARVDGEVAAVVTCYFDYFHAAYPVFYPAGFVYRVARGEIDAAVIAAMRVCTARVMGRAAERARLEDEAQHAVAVRMGSPTIDTLRALVVLAAGEALACSSLVSLAASLVMRFGWNALDLCDARKTTLREWIEAEAVRRTVWAVYQADSYQALLADRPLSVPAKHTFVRSPDVDLVWDQLDVPAALDKERQAHPLHVESGLVDGAVQTTTDSLFNDTTRLADIVAQINDFLWDARIRSPPAPSLWVSARFIELDAAVNAWKADLPPMARLTKACDFGGLREMRDFGSARHRQAVLRARCFCIHCYGVVVTLYLHLANRPSLAATATRLDNPAYAALSALWEASLAAADVEARSWAACLAAVRSFCTHIEANRDIPPERLDHTIPFCVFVSATVLVRHVRTCKHTIGAGLPDDALRAEVAEYSALATRLWMLLQELGRVWDVANIERALRAMQIGEVVECSTEQP